MTDHLEEAQASLRYAESDDAIGKVTEGTSDQTFGAQTAIAHALIDIAESLRWFKEQKEYDLNHKTGEYRPTYVD